MSFVAVLAFAQLTLAAAGDAAPVREPQAEPARGPRAVAPLVERRAAVPAIARRVPAPIVLGGLSAGDAAPPAPSYSDWYYRRLDIHRYGSYAMLPLFVAQYIAGSQLASDGESDWAEDAHPVLAASVGVLFASNSVTGLWNLWESRKDPNDRRRRLTHATLMLLADAGFVATGILGDETEDGESASAHRTMAIASMSTATLGWLIMTDLFR